MGRVQDLIKAKEWLKSKFGAIKFDMFTEDEILSLWAGLVDKKEELDKFYAEYCNNVYRQLIKLKLAEEVAEGVKDVAVLTKAIYNN